MTDLRKIKVQFAKDTGFHDVVAGHGHTTHIFHAAEITVSDGSHTIDELYEHRNELFRALANMVDVLRGHIEKMRDNLPIPADLKAPAVWRSHHHSDGTMFPGYFIMGIAEEPGKQITYHLPIKYWDSTDFAFTMQRAPTWDGHTPADVLERLKTL